MSRAQIIDRDPGHVPLFYRDLRDVVFFFKDFIYLCDRETASERENTAGGEGEEEAGSQQRSPMRGSIPERRDHAPSQRQTLNDCATQAPQDFIYLFDREGERAQAGGGAEGEAGSPLSKEPNATLDPRTLES